MDGFIGMVVAITVGILTVQGVLAWRWSPARRRTLVGRFAGSRSLQLDAEATALAERLLIARHKGRFVGAAGSIAVTLGTWLVVGPLSGDTGVLARHTFVVTSALVVAANASSQIVATIAGATAMRRAAARRSGGGTRYARVPTASLDDLLPPLMRWWSATLLGIAVAGVVACVAAGVDLAPVGRRELAVCVAVSTAAVLAAEVAARVLARTPLPAGSPAALAVGDEIRSDLATVVLAGMIGPAFLCLYMASRALPEAGVTVAPILVLPIAALEAQRRRRVRRRLWRAS